jgi:hypothetical protein
LATLKMARQRRAPCFLVICKTHRRTTGPRNGIDPRL